MKKKTYSNTTLTCTLQQSDELQESQCLTGIISKTREGFRFEEAVHKGRPPHNPKLYDGKYISMVRRKNGRYQCHIKTFDPKEMDRSRVAYDIYAEISQAFQIID